jgi:hypothetical protein
MAASSQDAARSKAVGVPAGVHLQFVAHRPDTAHACGGGPRIRELGAATAGRHARPGGRPVRLGTLGTFAADRWGQAGRTGPGRVLIFNDLRAG